MDLWTKNTVKYIISYAVSFLFGFITLKLAGQIPNAGLVYEAMGLGGGIVFTFEMGVRFWVHRGREAFWTAFMVRSILSLMFLPLIVLFNPLALPFLVLEPILLVNDLLISEKRITILLLGNVVHGLIQVIFAFISDIAGMWTILYFGFVFALGVNLLFKLYFVNLPSFHLMFDRIRGMLADLIALHLSVSLNIVIPSIGAGLLGLFMNPDWILRYYAVATISFAFWEALSLVTPMNIVHERGGTLSWLFIPLSVGGALGSPIISGLLGFPEITIPLAVSFIAGIPTSLIYSWYGEWWKQGGGMWKLMMGESALKIVGSIIFPPILGLEWIGLSQMIGASLVLIMVEKGENGSGRRLR